MAIMLMIVGFILAGAGGALGNYTETREVEVPGIPTPALTEYHPYEEEGIVLLFVGAIMGLAGALTVKHYSMCLKQALDKLEELARTMVTPEQGDDTNVL